MAKSEVATQILVTTQTATTSQQLQQNTQSNKQLASELTEIVNGIVAKDPKAIVAKYLPKLKRIKERV